MASSIPYQTAFQDVAPRTGILRNTAHPSDGPGPDVMNAATLIGDDVVNDAGEDLGEIEAIMLDVASGRIAYAVLQFDNKLFAVPWDALTLDAVEKRFVLPVTKERLAEAPGFDRDHWPTMAEPDWIEKIRAYYEDLPYLGDDPLSQSSG
jgi:sporulation protein YlmC with PRC-barrel domain